MRMYDIIKQKRDGFELTKKQIEFVVNGYVKGDIPDYQISAFLMAVYFKGMTDNETVLLTNAMANSGDTVDLSCFNGLSADKHSTGGVGDKTTLIVAPIAAAMGLFVAKMSGRGLGHTGGTVDKLESIKGYKTSLLPSEFLEQVKNIGIAVIGQTGNLAPADKKLYALRDVTATVESIPLIASSIMSKKIASGAECIVLDVKLGSGAFMKDLKSAELLAEKMVEIGKNSNRKVAAVISNMDIPLGRCIGNSLEIEEAIKVLRCEQKGDLREISLNLAAAMASLGFNIPFELAYKKAEQTLDSLAAFNKFKEWISTQGGEKDIADNTELLGKARYSKTFTANTSGYIGFMDAEKIGIAACNLGAGRATMQDTIDRTAGIVLNKKTGEYVTKGEVIATMYSNNEQAFLNAENILSQAVRITDSTVQEQTLIKRIII